MLRYGILIIYHKNHPNPCTYNIYIYNIKHGTIESLGIPTDFPWFINHKWSIYGIIPSCCRAIWPPFLEIWCAMISASDTTSRAAWAETLSIRGKWIGWREHGQEKTQKNRNVLFFPSHITYDNEFIHLDMSTRSSFF